MDNSHIANGRTKMKSQWIRIYSSQAEKNSNCARAIKENESTNRTINKE